MNLQYFFSPDRPVALVLNAIIVVAFSLGVLAVVRALFRLRSEQGALDAVTAADPATAEQASGLISRLPKSTIVREHLELLQAMKRRARSIDEASLITMAEDALHQRVATPVFLRSTLVLLGLAGTLWGLSLSITDLSDFLGGSVSSVEHMKNAILGTLAGMETAFSTTLAGVAGAVLLSLMTRWYEGRKSAFLQRLEHVNLSTLVPLYDTSESSVLDMAAKRLEKLTSSMEDRLDTLLDRLDRRGEQLTEEIGAAVDQFVDTFADRSKALLKEIAEIRERTVAIFGSPAEGQKSLADQIGGFTTGIESLQQTTEDVRLLIPQLSDALTAAIEEQRTALGEVLEEESLEVKKLNQLHEQWGESLHAATERIAAGQDEFVRQSGQLAEAARQFNSSWERIEGSLKGTEQDIGRSMEALRQGIRQTLEEVADSYESTHKAVLTALTQFETALKETNAAVAAEPRRAVRQSSELLEELDRVVRSVLPELAQTMADAGAAGSSQVERAVQELTREIRSLPGNNGRPKVHRPAETPSEEPAQGTTREMESDALGELQKIYSDSDGGAEEETTE